MKYKLILVLGFVILVTGYKSAFAQHNSYKYYGLFMYKFTQNFNWPSDYKKGDFIIGVLGKSEVISSLNQIAKHRKVGQRRIKVHHYSSANTISEHCHILFVSKHNRRELERVLDNHIQTSTLIITEGADMRHAGGMVNFSEKNKQIILEINKKRLKEAKIQASKQLLDLAVII